MYGDQPRCVSEQVVDPATEGAALQRSKGLLLIAACGGYEVFNPPSSMTGRVTLPADAAEEAVVVRVWRDEPRRKRRCRE